MNACPVAILDLMEQCLEVDPTNRPTAKEIVLKLQGHMKELGQAPKRFPTGELDAAAAERADNSAADEPAGCTGSSNEGGNPPAAAPSKAKCQMRTRAAPKSLKVLLCKLASPFERLAMQGFPITLSSSSTRDSLRSDATDEADIQSVSEE